MVGCNTVYADVGHGGWQTVFEMGNLIFMSEKWLQIRAEPLKMGQPPISKPLRY